MSTALNCVATQKNAKNMITTAYIVRCSELPMSPSLSPNVRSAPRKPVDSEGIFLSSIAGIWRSGCAKMMGITPV